MAVLALPRPSRQNYASLIRRKLLSTLLAVATFTVVWLVVSPASAMNRAPVCDPRGAIGFAPPPQIQDAELSLDIPADCFDESPLDTKNYVPGHPSAPLDISSSREPVTQTVIVLPALMLAERLPIRAHEEGRPSPGFRASLDRPPRA
jgi:hypothetical protein